MAVISLDFSSTATWPSSRWLAVAQAWTRCKADWPLARSNDRRRVLPSMAMTCRSVASCRASIQPRKPFRNSSGSSRSKRRRKVSCEGMPLGRSRKVFSQSCLALPKSSMSSQESAPATTAQMAMATMSSSSWSRERSMRGSVNSAKWWARESSWSAVMAILLDASGSRRITRSRGRSPPSAVTSECPHGAPTLAGCLGRSRARPAGY